MTGPESSPSPVPPGETAEAATPPNRRWITVLVVIALAAGILILALIRPWIPSPDSIIKEAGDRTKVVSSCRMSSVETENTVEDTTVITTAQGEYSVPFRSSLEVSRDGTDYRFISIGQDTWVKGGDDAGSLISGGLLSDLFVRGPQAVVSAVGYLQNVERHVDQFIDGVACYHYSGTFIDPDGDEADSLEEEIHPDDYEYLLNLHDRSTTTMLADVWIDKEKSYLRQVRVVVRDRDTRDTVVSATMKIYDFNEELVIGPPFNEEDTLLDGWQVYGS